MTQDDALYRFRVRAFALRRGDGQRRSRLTGASRCFPRNARGRWCGRATGPPGREARADYAQIFMTVLDDDTLGCGARGRRSQSQARALFRNRMCPRGQGASSSYLLPATPEGKMQFGLGGLEAFIKWQEPES